MVQTSIHFRLAAVIASIGAAAAAACNRGDRSKSTGNPDRECLSFLRQVALPFTASAPVRGIRTPVVVRGSFQGITLVPRGRREALMDCTLARALYEAAPVFRAAGAGGLEYSAAYDYRQRRDAAVMSAHAHGLAIDVHAIRTPTRRYLVAGDFERGVGEWKRLRPGPGALAACIGQPRTDPGRVLRTLVCRLKLNTSFRVLVTPDDNADHRDHLHLEVFPDVAPDVPGAPS
jgi:hypothetical protein